MVTSVLNIFASSPFKPLQDHARRVQACVEGLIPYFQFVFQQNLQEMTQQYQKIATLEHEADDMKRHIRQHLPTSLFMPVSRSDLLDLLAAQDKLANKAKDIAGIVLGRKMHIPEDIQTTFLQYVQASVSATEQAVRVGSAFDELVETGFKGHEAKRVTAEITQLSKIEKESDNLQIAIRSHLFSLEKDLPPVDVIFIYKVIDRIGEIADQAQHVGHCIDLLLAN